MFEFETRNITKPWPSATSSHSGCSTGVSGTSRKVTASRYSGCLACPPCSASSHRPFFWLEMPEQIGRTLCRHMSPYIAVIMILHKSHCDTYFVRSFCVLTIIRQRLYPISVKLANLVHWPYIIHNPIEISTWAPSASIWVALWIQKCYPVPSESLCISLHCSALSDSPRAGRRPPSPSTPSAPSAPSASAPGSQALCTLPSQPSQVLLPRCGLPSLLPAKESVQEIGRHMWRQRTMDHQHSFMKARQKLRQSEPS